MSDLNRRLSKIEGVAGKKPVKMFFLDQNPQKSQEAREQADRLEELYGRDYDLMIISWEG